MYVGSIISFSYQLLTLGSGTVANFYFIKITNETTQIDSNTKIVIEQVIYT